MNRTLKGLVAAGILAFSGTLIAQQGAPGGPEISFDSADLLKWDDSHIIGEVGGVGQDSKGRVYVYTRTGHAYATLGDNRTFQRTDRNCFSTTRPASSCANWDRTCTASTSPTVCASIRRTTCGRSTPAPARS